MEKQARRINLQQKALSFERRSKRSRRRNGEEQANEILMVFSLDMELQEKGAETAWKLRS